MAQELTMLSASNTGCHACRGAEERGFDLTMAFQPIVDIHARTVFAYEALVRGKNGDSAQDLLGRITEENRYSFDQECRVKAIELAAKLGVAERGAKLSVNFMPGAVYSPAACIRRTLRAAKENNFPLDAIIFEITEGERVIDVPHLRGIAHEYAKHGFTLALDDFGAGFSGLNLLAELEGVQLVKIDGYLVQKLSESGRANQIVASIAAMCQQLGISVVAECVETKEQVSLLRGCGINLMQGYLFARPETEALPPVRWPEEETAAGLRFVEKQEKAEPGVVHANVA